jgi:hypothetical protein
VSTPLFKKLNLTDHDVVHVLEAPESFDAELTALVGVTVKRAIGRSDRVTFGIGFATTKAGLDAVSRALTAKAEGDAILWIAYPKGTSKRYHCDFNRDSGFDTLGAAGFEGVRQVAIDEDWSALRFRRVEHVKSLTREVSRALTAEGKQRTQARRR